ncbi:thymidine kinase 2, mitochondrial [Petromyzon marinus]|uniref:thymidine kinase 2, mitochondrial n=1 Tax=Petromyzon marinus TaxID=7757 RepID=UPI003F6F47D2
MRALLIAASCRAAPLFAEALRRGGFSTGRFRSQNLVVSVEGNIGCGKTKCLEYFQGSPGIEVVAEPVTKWRNIWGHNLLALLYSDPKRWSLTLQTYVQLTMIMNHTSPSTTPVRMMERSIFSARYIFVENLFRSGLMPEVEYAVLGEWFDWLTKTIPIPVDLIVYLQASPQTCHERLKSRSREEERVVPLEYLQSLHSLYESWLVDKSIFRLPAPVLVIPAEESLERMYTVFEEARPLILRPNSKNTLGA